ncbi:hypothetical protein ZIOFF_009030 [Zingiber officinale]|uniref:Uncharacterized protein n=1 Tax=Zingiber officinale TaxID=94328 RepID=A0A8J5HMD4_ZINOF|nr:hypothetical protein ZIOFF_009030 [Zingiber officinale]
MEVRTTQEWKMVRVRTETFVVSECGRNALQWHEKLLSGLQKRLVFHWFPCPHHPSPPQEHEPCSKGRGGFLVVISAAAREKQRRQPTFFLLPRRRRSWSPAAPLFYPLPSGLHYSVAVAYSVQHLLLFRRPALPPFPAAYPTAGAASSSTSWCFQSTLATARVGDQHLSGLPECAYWQPQAAPPPAGSVSSGPLLPAGPVAKQYAAVSVTVDRKGQLKDQKEGQAKERRSRVNGPSLTSFCSSVLQLVGGGAIKEGALKARVHSDRRGAVMDSYEATRTVFARLQSLDPENAHKIMGFLLLQENGEKDIIRLAFGPEAHLYALVTKARKELGLAAASAVSPSSFLLRQNSASRLLSPSWHAPAAAAAFSRSNSSSLDELLSPEELVGAKNVNAPPFYGGGDLADEFHLPDQLSFRDGVDCRGPTRSGDPAAFSYGTGWGVNGYHHRRSASAAADLRLGDAVGGLGWEPCLYFARGYCKNGDSCRFLHGLPEEAAATIAAKMDTAAAVEQQCQELLLRSNSQRIGGSSQLMASAIPFSPAGSDRPSPLSPSTKSLNFLLQQQQNESQRYLLSASRHLYPSLNLCYSLSNYCRAAAAALMLGADEAHKFLSRSRSDLLANPSSRQIYLTFPADSTFSEEDVSNYFSIYGPVQDVRIPYQQKRMFGFVTFLYPETVKLILAKGNPHFVCDSRVLVKPYKEKGKVPDKFRYSSILFPTRSCSVPVLLYPHLHLKLRCSSFECYRKQQLCERGDFYGCTTPTSLDAREAYDLHQVGTRMLYNSSCQELLLRRKLEEQQQAAELQRAIELQGRRFMGLQLLDLKNRSLSSAAIASTNSPTFTPNTLVNPLDVSCNGGGGSSSSSSPDESPTGARITQNYCSFIHSINLLSILEDKDKPLADVNNNEDSDVQPSTKHNLPDSPFASPTKKSSSFALDLFSTSEEDLIASCTANNGGNSFNNTHLDMPSFDPCFKMPTFSSGFGAIGM